MISTRRQYGLHRCAVEVFHGFIFASFAPRPASLEGLRRDLDAALAPFGLARCKVAVQRTYPVRANWKLVLENFMECYHCAPAHPEFAQSHAIKLPPGSYPELEEALRARSTLVTDVIANKYPTDPAGGFIYYYDRYPLFEGYSTGSEDGKPVAPLLGDIQQFDGGASNGSYGLLCYTLVYSDHCVVYRFTPRSVAETEMDIVWLVDGDAREGADYDLDRLTWLWHVTTEADQAIIERNQRGVQSRFYQPGPYAPMERHVAGFVEWYLRVLGEPAG